MSPRNLAKITNKLSIKRKKANYQASGSHKPVGTAIHVADKEDLESKLRNDKEEQLILIKRKVHVGI